MATTNEIFQSKLTAYLSADKAGKQAILDTVCSITKLHRKAAIRKFKALQLKRSSQPEQRGRPAYYTPDVTLALRDIWSAASELCGELIHPIIHDYVTILKRDGMWPHGKETTAKLLRMSEITVKRRVGKFMAGKTPRKGLSATKPGALKEIIPIFTGPWQDKPPGYGQLDTVVHCGSSLLGSMAFTVNWTDVATLWGGRRAQWNKGQYATQESLAAIRDRLPFTMLGVHPDTGSEFINWHLKGWCDEQHIEMTRSRPNHKNDNAYVEQKNGHIVRRFLGYTRFDCRETVELMNDLYNVLDVYLNHFVPSRKCLEKVRIGSRYKKCYDKAQTPYQRVLASSNISDTIKAGLKAEHERLNPLLLRREIDTLTTLIFKKQKEGARHG
jgi:hypothetical protein